MKECRQCGQSVQDVETYCPRCGSGNLVSIQDGRQPRPQNRPQQSFGNNPNQNQYRQPQPAPPGFRNPNAVPNRPTQPMQNGQRPMNNGQRPMQNGQMPMNNGQRPMQNGQMPMQNGGMNGYEQRPMQPPRGQMLGIADEFEEEAPKKGLFGKKGKKEPKPEKPKKLSRKEKKAQQFAEMQNNGFGNEFNSTEQTMMQNRQAQQFVPQSHNMNGNDFESSAVGNFDEVVTVKEWFFMLIKMMIPIYNIIFLIKALSGNTNSKQSMVNYLKLCAIMLVISIGFGVLTGILVFILGALG